MLLGWLKQRRMDRQELNELRAFQRDMEQHLETMDVLLQIIEGESPEITVGHFLDPTYFEMPANRDVHHTPIAPIPSRVEFPMPAPEVQIYSAPCEFRHRMVEFAMKVSEAEVMFTDRPSHIKALADNVARRLVRAMENKVYGSLRECNSIG